MSDPQEMSDDELAHRITETLREVRRLTSEARSRQLRVWFSLPINDTGQYPSVEITKVLGVKDA